MTSRALIAVVVKEARGLFAEEGKDCNPYVAIKLEAPRYQIPQGKSAIKAKTTSPTWSETFRFTVSPEVLGSMKLLCSVHNADGEGVVGELEPVEVQALAGQPARDAWFDLRPPPGASFPAGSAPQIHLSLEVSVSGDPLPVPAAAAAATTPSPPAGGAVGPRPPGPGLAAGAGPAAGGKPVVIDREKVQHVTLVRLDPDGSGLGRVGLGYFKRALEDPFTVQDLAPAGAAAKTGRLRPGDLLVEVDGKTLLGIDSAEAAKLLQGAPGTSVTIGFLPH